MRVTLAPKALTHRLQDRPQKLKAPDVVELLVDMEREAEFCILLLCR